MADSSYARQPRLPAMRGTAPSSRRMTTLRNGSDVRHKSAPQPSRLEQMQANFQKKILLDKERKLTALLHDEQTIQAYSAPAKLQAMHAKNNPVRHCEKKGVVREFFQERRQMEKSGNVDRMPAATSHLQQLRSEKDTLHLQEQIKQEELEHFARTQRTVQPQKSRVGYSKHKPLAPIKPQSTNPTEDSSQSRHVGHLGAPIQRTKGQQRLKKKSISNSSIRNLPGIRPQENRVIGSEARKPPRRLPDVSQSNKPPPLSRMMQSDELSDFQKWQLEQDQQREVRLKAYEDDLEKREGRPFSGTFDRDDSAPAARKQKGRLEQKYEDIHEKERELESLIAKQQEELAALQMNESDSDDENELNHESISLPVEEGSTENHRTIREHPTNTEHHYDRNSNRIGKIHEEAERVVQENSKVHPKGQKLSGETVTPKREKEKSVLRGNKQRAMQANDVERDTTVQMESALPEDGPAMNLKPCQICGRKFAAERIPKHEQICQKSSNTKRKVFDSTSHRAKGTDHFEYVREGRHLNEPDKKPVSSWKKKHEDFVSAIRDARKVQAHIAKGGKISDLPPPPPAENPDYKQCPYCKRRFNPSTAERHIPHCKDTKSRPKPPPQQRGLRGKPRAGPKHGL